MKWYWIHIDGESQRFRKEHMLKQFNDLNIEKENIELINATTPSTQMKLLYPPLHITKQTSPEEFACTTSHLNAIKRSYENGDEMCIIAEDDVVIPALFVDNVEKLIETAPKSWECLQISNSNIKRCLTLFNFNYLKNQLWVPWHANYWSATLYIMNRKGMGKILNTYYKSDHIDLSSCKMKPVADIVMFSTIETFTITYPMIHGLDKNSTIHPTHVEGHSKCTSYIKKIMSEYKLQYH
jgi:GR25 family glycosyltransferase involved in LPS biosynthesis